MALEDLASEFRKKGFVRQAVLLESNYREEYLTALSNPKWTERLREDLGRELHEKLIEDKRLEKALEKLFGTSAEENTESFNPRIIESKPLELTFEYELTKSDVVKAYKIYKDLIKSQKEALILIYKEVKDLTKKDKELLFSIYKDNDWVIGLNNKNAIARYKEKLKNRIKNLNRWREDYEKYEEKSLSYLRQLDYTLQLVFDLMPSIRINNKDINVRLEESYERIRKISDTEIEKEFNYFKQNSKTRIIKNAILEIDIEHLEKDPFELFIENSDKMNEEEIVETILTANLKERSKFLDDYYYFDLKKAQDNIIGMYQIITGGPITNPNAHPNSVLQNHGLFPNIKYSRKTKDHLEKIVRENAELLKKLPDISDLALPSKLKGKRTLTYTMEELEKYPLDVTYGNDSGCCIFVPEEIDKLMMGYTIPILLSEQEIRLFANFVKVNEKKKQRFGLVIGFETYIENAPEQKILACNSLELSRFGIKGGNQTVKAINDYNENGLIQYAEQYNYKGIVMGNHDYNTSVNHSAKTGDVVKETLVYAGRNTEFYSDIFEKQDGKMRTREGSLYWLWRKP